MLFDYSTNKMSELVIGKELECVCVCVFSNKTYQQPPSGSLSRGAAHTASAPSSASSCITITTNGSGADGVTVSHRNLGLVRGKKEEQDHLLYVNISNLCVLKNCVH